MPSRDHNLGRSEPRAAAGREDMPTNVVDAVRRVSWVFRLAGVVLAGALTGVGLWLRRACNAGEADLDGCFLAFWTGFSLVILFLIVWHFWLPITGLVLAIVLAFGGLGLISSAGTLKHNLVSIAIARHRIAFASAIAASVWIANQAMSGVNSLGSQVQTLQQDVNGLKAKHRGERG